MGNSLTCLISGSSGLTFSLSVGWGTDQRGFGEQPGMKTQMLNLVRSIRTVMRSKLYKTWDILYTNYDEYLSFFEFSILTNCVAKGCMLIKFSFIEVLLRGALYIQTVTNLLNKYIF